MNFIRPPLTSIHHQGNTYHNHPVNINRCYTFRPIDGRESLLDGEVYRPGIQFYFCEGPSVLWIFTDEAERDVVLSNLMASYVYQMKD